MNLQGNKNLVIIRPHGFGSLTYHANVALGHMEARISNSWASFYFYAGVKTGP